ncbi:hypothetical protein ZIOFF_005314 [Zingiber officinale]|uniref:Myb/SANT-like domain-containing protein n=1 Tax=Zingiber officinale TaxID=94328 RepID=A0A8J5HW85_ZINOF|nr:hypothetical protein ZIOFF_005314 [Zingiber officinale]
MKFIYVLIGWEGSAADARVLRDALTHDDSLKVPRGCYYLCDNGYANVEGFLTPYMRMPNDLMEEVDEDVGSPSHDTEDYYITTMDSGSTSGSLVGKGKKAEKTRRSWSVHEEEVLIQALKDVINKGWKSENGFRAGYLTLLENAMRAAIPGTNIHGNPHINSKVHVWKKTHGTLVTILSKSGVGWNDTDTTIEGTDEAWEAIIQSDHTTRSMRHKQWPYYQDWCEIFGNDRATGEHAETFTSALQDVLNMDYEVVNDMVDGGNYISHGVDGDGESMSAMHTLSSKPSVGATSHNQGYNEGFDQRASNSGADIKCTGEGIGCLDGDSRANGGGESSMAMEVIYLMDRDYLVLFAGFVYLFGGVLPSNCFTVIGPGGLMAMEVIYLMDRDYLVLFAGFVYLFGGFLPSNCFIVIGPSGVLTDWWNV